MNNPTDPRPHDGAFTQRFAGEHLRQRRRELDLSRTAVARAAGLTPATVKAMERNRVRPSDAAFARLANVLGLTDEAARARLMVAGPVDQRPTEFASEVATARVPNDRGHRLSGLFAKGRGRRERAR
jgi:transcriptional regulator with XRE-family HTH domain